MLSKRRYESCPCGNLIHTAVRTEMTYCDINADNTKNTESKWPRLEINHQQPTAVQLTNVPLHGLDDCASFCTKGYRIPAEYVLVTKRRNKNADMPPGCARMRLPLSVTRNLCPGTEQPRRPEFVLRDKCSQWDRQVLLSDLITVGCRQIVFYGRHQEIILSYI